MQECECCAEGARGLSTACWIDRWHESSGCNKRTQPPQSGCDRLRPFAINPSDYNFGGSTGGASGVGAGVGTSGLTSTMGAGGEGGAASCGVGATAFAGVTGRGSGSGSGATFFAGAETDFATFPLALTGVIVSLRMVVGAGGIAFAASVPGIALSALAAVPSVAAATGAVGGAILFVIAADGRAGAGANVALLISTPSCPENIPIHAAIPAPAAINSAAIHTGRMAFAEKLPELS